MLDFVLENNFFTFNNRNYLQIEGTAIGSRLGRNYACTYMGAWEGVLLSKCEEKPLLFVRYVDDIFGVWVGDRQGLQSFHNMANKIHKNIKLELRTSQKEIEFLDIMIKLGDKNEFITDIYEKKKQTATCIFTKSPTIRPRQKTK